MDVSLALAWTLAVMPIAIIVLVRQGGPLGQACVTLGVEGMASSLSGAAPPPRAALLLASVPLMLLLLPHIGGPQLLAWILAKDFYMRWLLRKIPGGCATQQPRGVARRPTAVAAQPPKRKPQQREGRAHMGSTAASMQAREEDASANHRCSLTLTRALTASPLSPCLRVSPCLLTSWSPFNDPTRR
jgi:hypothetical protein